MQKKWLQFIILALVAVLVVGGGYLWASRGSDREEVPGVVAEPVGDEVVEEDGVEKRSAVGKSEIADSEGVIDTSDWKTYRNDEVGFTFKHPPEYCVGFFPNIEEMEYYIKIADSGMVQRRVTQMYTRKNP